MTRQLTQPTIRGRNTPVRRKTGKLEASCRTATLCAPLALGQPTSERLHRPLQKRRPRRQPRFACGQTRPEGVSVSGLKTAFKRANPTPPRMASRRVARFSNGLQQAPPTQRTPLGRSPGRRARVTMHMTVPPMGGGHGGVPNIPRGPLPKGLRDTMAAPVKVAPFIYI